jgi:hypothetical protein
MPWTQQHLRWLKKTTLSIKTADGVLIEVWEFRHQRDEAILSAWAKHFRNHYCLDTEIDFLKRGTGYSRAAYLTTIKFPDAAQGLGPGIRAGDFGEVLVADYLQYVLGYWVPRTRYADKNIRNESGKGCDIVGFKCLTNGKESPDDTLAIYEAKAQFSGTKAEPKLQEAVEGSAKDFLRRAESLNAIKQHLFHGGKLAEVSRVERFQDPEDHPYREIFGAAALFSTNVYDPAVIGETKVEAHPRKTNLSLVVIRGVDMMPLVHELYRRAADEA